MTVQSKTVLKTYFIARHKPTQSEFEDLIDTFATVGSVTEYKDITVGPAGSDADYVCDGTADQVQIQAAIDSIAAIPQGVIKYPDGTPYSGTGACGKVIIQRGAYSISGTIILKSNVHLVLSKGTALFPVADVDIIWMQKGSCIDGGGQITAAAFHDYSHDLIHIDGVEQIFVGGTSVPMFIRDIFLSGGGDKLATAIHFYAGFASTGESDLECIYGITVDNVAIINCGYGIKLEMLYFNWIASNHFSNISINGTQNPIYLIGDPDPAARGPYDNMFVSIAIEMGVSVPTGVGVYCDGWQNSFSPIIIWDVGAGGASINFTSKSTKNHIAGRLEAPRIDLGVLNVVDDWGS